ncbi:MAG: cobalamin-binding protein [Xanthomonadales bacterium]|nr:cobalamin-binding protein [Gammaproteobacteria bacterium]NNE04250.1 cobalamin-binding protein [Xanthomonadales bacterium]NNL94850.1 cobalamin-binding protein [Xanthomonadales bacterium]
MTPRRLGIAGLLSGLLLSGLVMAEQSIRLPQSNGHELVLEGPATRIITLAPGLAEMVFAAGAGDKLIATVEFSNYPADAERLPRIGDAFRFDLERIIAIDPDLVMAWTSGNPPAALDRLESLGQKVWRIEMRTPRQIGETLRMVSRATGNDASGLARADELVQRADALQARYAGLKPVRYFYQVAERPLYTLNGEHIVSRGLALCGGVNIFADLAVIAPRVSREAVILADPEIMLAPVVGGRPDPLQHWREWPRLQAVKSGELHGLPADEISRATPRLLDSLELACTLLDRFRSH